MKATTSKTNKQPNKKATFKKQYQASFLKIGVDRDSGVQHSRPAVNNMQPAF